MKAREVRDENKTTWSCVQAFAGTNGKAAEKAADIMKKEGNTVQVICTPSGGSQTVRLDLNHNWLETLSDEDLVNAIKKEQ
jgi:hypothetical protein